jgi:hypothetical protein
MLLLKRNIAIILQAHDKRFDKMGQRFNKMDKTFRIKMDKRFDKVDQRSIKMDKRFDEQESILIRLDKERIFLLWSMLKRVVKED